ncbi:P2Y purinoceptor 13-like [Girardinichthys multiradiatus]|uniref:P2Y purinoceptor 13-like n=1 Tax=Girardinichthys multiradiatus TaxID=208333 RepID=UPI001FACDE5C|nr:P2Y purinoceptor 13-like [Girardinichthys multiradiatus]
MADYLDLQIYANQQDAVDHSLYTSLNQSECDSFTYNAYIVPTLFLLMFPIALLLNVVAAWVSVHLKSTSTFVVYLKNLVAADIIMTLMIPVKAVGDFPGTWEQLYGPTCRFFTVIFYNAQYTCIALLGLISLDRFFKIMMPQSRLLGQSLTMSKVISATVWLVLFGGTGLPNILLTNKSVANISLITTCVVLKGPAGVKFHETTSLLLNIFFWLVSLVIMVCYICIANRVIQSYRNSGSNNSNGKQKIKLRVFLVVIVFFISFGPYHMIRIPYTSQQVSYSKTDCSHTYEYLRFAKELSHWLATTNICMDPLIYVFLCREFKEKLMSMMKTGFISFKGNSK